MHGLSRLFWLLLTFAAALFVSASVAISCGEEIWYSLLTQRSRRCRALRAFPRRPGLPQQTRLQASRLAASAQKHPHEESRPDQAVLGPTLRHLLQTHQRDLCGQQALLEQKQALSDRQDRILRREQKPRRAWVDRPQTQNLGRPGQQVARRNKYPQLSQKDRSRATPTGTPRTRSRSSPVARMQPDRLRCALKETYE